MHDFVKGLHKEVWGYNLEISLIGIENDNPYFSQDKDLPKAKNKVVISSAMAQKYDLKKGDSIILSDEEDEMDYAFQVAISHNILLGYMHLWISTA